MGTTERHLIRGRDSHQDIVAAVVTIIGCAAKVRESPFSPDGAPIEGMARIAMDETMPIVGTRMFSELAQYIAPKCRAIEHSGDGATQQFVIMGAQPDATAEDWERRNSPDRSKPQ